MREHIELAIDNIIRHGDTDIFPFPFENRAFFDDRQEIVDLLLEYHANFDDYLTRYPPEHVNSLSPAGYTGFRWVSQFDPVWNAYFLACVLSIAEPIEQARIPADQRVIFSYRYAPDRDQGDLFSREYSWAEFMRRSLGLTEDFDHVVVCDIAEFYPRIGHHRLENALQHIDDESDAPHRILRFLENFTNTRSFGLPIGGPAARILSEITINQVDRLLRNQNIVFVRFADDYHLFANSKEEAYQHLIFLSEKLFDNQGLSLQKSKTRILTAAEFRATSPVQEPGEEAEQQQDPENMDEAQVGDILPPRSLFHFSIAFDPYSANAEEDYERLKAELRRFDIVGLLKSELQKTRIHAALSRKIVQAIRYLDEQNRNDAVVSLMENCDVLYPIFSSVLVLVDQVFEDLSDEAKALIFQRLRELIDQNSHIMRVDIHVAFSIRVLSHDASEESRALLERLYTQRTSPLIRRNIILTIARWNGWYWLSDLRNRYRALSAAEKRAFIASSYVLRDEGRHWRRHVRNEFTPFENFVKNWVARRIQEEGWQIPL